MRTSGESRPYIRCDDEDADVMGYPPWTGRKNYMVSRMVAPGYLTALFLRPEDYTRSPSSPRADEACFTHLEWRG